MTDGRVPVRTLALVVVASSVFYVGMAFLTPVVPVHLARLGASDTLVGIATGAFAAGVLFGRPFSGTLAARRRRTLVMAAGTAVAGAACLACAALAAPGGFVPVRFVQGIGFSLYGTSAITTAADLSPPARRGEVLAYYGLSWTVAGAFGPVLGERFVAWGGPAAPFVAAALAAAAACALIATVKLPDRPAESDGPPRPVLASLAASFAAPNVRTAVVLALGVAASFGTMLAFLPAHLAATGAPLSAGLWWGIDAGAVLFARSAAGFLADRVGARRVALAAVPIIVCGVALAAVGRGAPLVVAAAVLHGAGYGSFFPSAASLVAEGRSGAERGPSYATFLMAFDLGVFSGGAALGPLVERAGTTAALLVMACVVAAAGAAALTVARAARTGAR